MYFLCMPKCVLCDGYCSGLVSKEGLGPAEAKVFILYACMVRRYAAAASHTEHWRMCANTNTKGSHRARRNTRDTVFASNGLCRSGVWLLIAYGKERNCYGGNCWKFTGTFKVKRIWAMVFHWRIVQCVRNKRVKVLTESKRTTTTEIHGKIIV